MVSNRGNLRFDHGQNSQEIVCLHITRDITYINQQSTEVDECCDQLLLSAQEVAGMAVQLEDLVNRFKV